MVKKRLYLDIATKQMPRLLSLLDRSRGSYTYGSFDRSFWQYKSTDSRNARMQEAALTLVLAYSLKHPSNMYYRNKKILEWAEAAMMYWTKIQNRNGSFDEHYAGENSFVATAFSSYAMAEAVKNKDVSREVKSEVMSSLKKAGHWLSRNEESRCINQTIGSAAALQNIYEVTRKPEYKKAAKKKLAYAKSLQSDEGWLPEYGGADMGYLCLAIDYLSKYHAMTKDKTAYDMARKALGFLSYFVFPDGTIGGDYGSRNTEFFIPSGIEYFSKHNKDAQYIKGLVTKGIMNSDVVTPASMDDRYMAYNLYTYLQAYNNFSDVRKAFSKQFEKTFYESRLFSKKTRNMHIVIGFGKGGVFKFQNKHYKYADAGIFAKVGKRSATSQWLDYSYMFDNMAVKGNMHVIPKFIPSASKTMLLRLGSTVSKKKLKEILRKRMIIKSPVTGIEFERSFQIGKDIIIEDVLRGKFDEASILNRHSPLHIPSSQYFQKQELFLTHSNTMKGSRRQLKIRRVLGKNKVSVEVL